MPFGAARLALFAKPQVEAVAEVIRRKVGVIAVADAQVDTAQSKFGGASALFDGTGDYLEATTSSDFTFGTGDFTIEMWIRYNTATATAVFFDLRPKGTSQFTYLSPTLYNTVSGGQAQIRYYNGSGGTNYIFATVNTGVWHHIAVSRSSGTTYLFLDGSLVHNFSDSLNYLSSGLLALGYNQTGTSSYFNGNIDELRISNTARYTTGFTPQTAPFTNDANTLLLLHMDGTDGSTFFEDDNGVRAPIGVSAIGDAQVDTAQSKFGGASLLLDGTGDYLQLESSPFAFGTNDFTMEAWIRPTTTSNMCIVDGRGGTSGENYFIILNNKLSWSNGSVYRQSTSTISANTWYHVVVSRSSGTLKLFIDGIEEGSWDDSTIDVNPGSGNYRIGLSSAGTIPFNGHIDEVRISNTARYTSGFTPPTAPFVNDANTLLLLHMDGTDTSTDFRDDNGKGRSAVGVFAIGNAQVDTAQSKFGGASALFDGTGDFLQIPHSSDFDITGGDFTAEAWVRATDNTSIKTIFGKRSTSGNAGWWLVLNSGGPLGTGQVQLAGWSGSSATLIAYSDTIISTNIWYHIAVVKDGSNFKLFVNGELEDTQADPGNLASSNFSLFIGRDQTQTTRDWNGHIDEIRFSNTARYTTGFTPATAPFTNDANTLLLLHMDGTDGSTTFIDDNGTYTV